jgi:dGTP triphosphohydrolase
LFQDPEIRSNDNAGAFKIRTLFEVFVRHYCDKPNNRLVDSGIVPADWHARIEQSSTDAERLRHITDYLAGMTDDYADMMFEKAIHSAL